MNASKRTACRLRGAAFVQKLPAAAPESITVTPKHSVGSLPAVCSLISRAAVTVPVLSQLCNTLQSGVEQCTRIADNSLREVWGVRYKSGSR